MKIAAQYSHLNGMEYLQVHKPGILREVKRVIRQVDAEACKTKRSQEKTMPGKLLYSPTDMNKAFKARLEACGWLTCARRRQPAGG